MAGDARLRLETDLGEIDVAVHVDRAPVTAAYLRRLVDDAMFTETAFYRSTTLSVADREPLIQGGPLASRIVASGGVHRRAEMLQSIETTTHTGLRHQRGTVSFARDLMATGHVLPELFICLDDYPELDAGGRSEPDERGFPAFGTLVSGHDVVAAIAALDTGGVSPFERLRGEVLTHPVRILRATYTDPDTESDD